MLIFCALVALAAGLFCWEFSVYQRWLAANRNPTAGLLLRFAQTTDWSMISAFEVKNPPLIREELASSSKTGSTTIHFLCPVSREGNFLMLSLFQHSRNWWILAIPIP